MTAPARAPRRLPFGFAEVLVVGATAFALFAVPPLLRHAGPRYASADRKIAAARKVAASKEPLDSLHWSRQGAEWGSAEMPGPARKVEVPTNYGPTNALVTGSDGQGVAVLEIPHVKQVPRSYYLSNDSVTLEQLGDELTGSMPFFPSVRFRNDPGKVVTIQQGEQVLDEQAYLADEASYGGQTLRIRTIERGGRRFLVVSVGPSGLPDAVIERVSSLLRVS